MRCLKAILLLMLLAATATQAQQPKLKYNSSGRLKQSQHDVYDNHDRLAASIVYTYDDSTGIVETRTLTGYNKKGHIRRVEVYSADDVLLFSDTYHYTLGGRLRHRIQKSFDENGTLIEKIKIEN